LTTQRKRSPAQPAGHGKRFQALSHSNPGAKTVSKQRDSLNHRVGMFLRRPDTSRPSRVHDQLSSDLTPIICGIGGPREWWVAQNHRLPRTVLMTGAFADYSFNNSLLKVYIFRDVDLMFVGEVEEQSYHVVLSARSMTVRIHHIRCYSHSIKHSHSSSFKSLTRR
jgi:hypothetical protein